MLLVFVSVYEFRTANVTNFGEFGNMDSCLSPNVAVGFQAKWYGVSGDDYGLVGLKLICADPLELVFDSYHSTSTCIEVASGFLTGKPYFYTRHDMI